MVEVEKVKEKRRSKNVIKRIGVVLASVALVALLSAPVLASGLNVDGISGGFLNPDATVAQRLTVGASFVDLNEVTVTTMSVAGTVLNRVELGVSRFNANNIKATEFNAKATIGKVNLFEGKLGLALAGGAGVVVFDSKLDHGDNSTNYYIVADTTVFKTVKLSLGANETDDSGEWKTLGFGSLSTDLKVYGLVLGAEFVQQIDADTNSVAGFVAKTVGNTTIKAGVADLSKTKTQQVFVGMSSAL